MLPKDPVILLSYVNMKLRDFYPSLEALCEAEDINPQELLAQLDAIDYHYDEKQNCFI